MEVEPREVVGSAESRRLRSRGYVPGVIYSDGKDATAFSVAERELRRALTGDHGMHAILDVVVGPGAKEQHAVLKEYQLHPTRRRLLHVDLHEVRLDRVIQATVTIELVGEAEGAKAGGVLNQVGREVTVEALPLEVPDRLELDVSVLEIGDSLRVADLAAPEGVTILDDPDAVVAAVTVPTKVEEPEPEEVEGEEELAEGEEPSEEQPEGEGSAESADEATGERSDQG